MPLREKKTPNLLEIYAIQVIAAFLKEQKHF